MVGAQSTAAAMQQVAGCAWVSLVSLLLGEPFRFDVTAVSLRSVSSDNVVVVDTTHGARVIGETDFNSAPATLHEKAIYLLEGALWTIGLTVNTLVFGFLLGLGLAVMRLSGNKWLSRAAQGYIWVFRGTPLLVQLIIIYTGLPQLDLVKLSVIESALIGLALNEAAYLAEILRGGILSVPKGQTEAARALVTGWLRFSARLWT